MRAAVVDGYQEVSIEAKDDYIYDENRAHLSIKLMFVNGTKYPIYTRTQDGNIASIPARLGGFNEFGTPTLHLKVNYLSKTQNRREYKHEHRYSILPEKIEKGSAVYLKEWGIYISTDKAFLKAIPMITDTAMEDRIRSAIFLSLSSMVQCPISVILNDPSGSIQYVYAVIDRQIYKIPVLSTGTYGKTCVVKFAGVHSTDNDTLYDFSLEELKKHFTEKKRYEPTVGSYKLSLFPTLEDAQDVVIQLQTDMAKRTLGITAREREAIKFEYQEEMRLKDNEITRLRQTVAIMESYIKQEDLIQQRTHTQSVQNMQLNKEKARVQKSEHDVSSASLSHSTTALKTATVVAPILAGCIGLCAAKFGALGVIGYSALHATPVMKIGISSMLGVCSTIGAKVMSTIGTVGKVICKGVVSACSWIAGWF